MLRNIQNDSERAALIRAMRQRTVLVERQREYWTDYEKEQLERLFAEGIGISDIALELKRTEEAVMQQIHRMNLYERIRRPNRKKKSQECLCKECAKYPECDHGSCSDTKPRIGQDEKAE